MSLSAATVSARARLTLWSAWRRSSASAASSAASPPRLDAALMRSPSRGHHTSRGTHSRRRRAGSTSTMTSVFASGPSRSITVTTVLTAGSMTTMSRLACVVLAHGPGASVDGAVASVLGQEPGVELVVVHSGGGAPATDARLVHEAALLMPGAARNRGIAATTAPFVAFLAADCRALPGWVAGRLREHDAGADLVADVLEPPDAVAPRAAWLMLHRRRAAATPSTLRLPFGLSYRR